MAQKQQPKIVQNYKDCAFQPPPFCELEIDLGGAKVRATAPTLKECKDICFTLTFHIQRRIRTDHELI